MNNHHDIVYVTQDDLDINQFRLLKFNPNVGFVETKTDLKALKDVFVFTKEEYKEKLNEIYKRAFRDGENCGSDGNILFGSREDYIDKFLKS